MHRFNTAIVSTIPRSYTQVAFRIGSEDDFIAEPLNSS